MLRFLIAVIVFAAAGLASAETCTSSASGTWSGATGSAGTATWTGCTPSVDDNFTIGHAVSVTAELGASAGPLQGTITVASGGSLSVSAGVTVYTNDSIIFNSGSCASDSCVIQGNRLTAISPTTVTYPTATTINFDFDALVVTGSSGTVGGDSDGLPWTICSSSCGANDIHVAAAGLAPTYIYVDWTKLGKNFYSQYAGAGAVDPDFVDAPGVWMEVTAVNPAGNDFTVTLPTLYAGTVTNNYTVAEAHTGNVLQNIVGGTGWTVNSVENRENNEGKFRYETLIEAADTPFNADQEFEGYLACKQGTNACLRITTTEADYDLTLTPAIPTVGTTDMIVTWRNPESATDPVWTDTNELDVYYAKIAPGDALIPVNPVKFDWTGADGTYQDAASAFRVRGGSGLATLKNIVFQEPYLDAADSNEGAISIENLSTLTGTKTLSMVLIEGFSTAARVAGVSATALPVALRMREYDGEDGGGITDTLWEYITIRWPRNAVDWTTNPTSDGFGSGAIQLSESTGHNFSAYDNVVAGTVSTWTNVGIRKVRIEGFTAGIGTATAGILKDCPDGVFIQDALVLHSRSTKPATYAHRGEDQIESWTTTPSCGYDRLVIGGSKVGTSLGPLRTARQGRVEYTSAVVFGGSGKTENIYTGWSSGDRPYINAGFAHQTYGTYAQGAEYHSHSAPGADSDGVLISNILTDSTIGWLSASYFERLGWWRNTTGMVFSHSCGQFMVGGYIVGGSYAQGIGDVGLGCTGQYDSVKLSNIYAVNLSRDYNNSSEQTCGLTGTGSGSYYPCVGSTVFPVLVAVSNNITAPAPKLVVEKSLFHRGYRGGTTNWGSWIEILNNSSVDIPLLQITDTSFIAQHGTANYVMKFDDRYLNDMLLNNVWTMGGGTLAGCFNDSSGDTITGTPTDLLCDFTAEGGPDYSTDDSPHGSSKLYLAGNFGTYNFEVVGTDSGEGDDVTDAQPDFAGLVAYEWPHLWATPEFRGVHRGEPMAQYIPRRIRDRLNVGGVGSAGGGFAPTPFGVQSGFPGAPGE